MGAFTTQMCTAVFLMAFEEKNIEDLIDKYADFLVKTQQQHRDEFYKLLVAYSLNSRPGKIFQQKKCETRWWKLGQNVNAHQF